MHCNRTARRGLGMLAATLLLGGAAALAAGVTTVERVSVSNAGSEAMGISSYPSLSADGRFVAFESEAFNLVSNDRNGASDVFVRDRVAGTTRPISLSTKRAQGNGASFSAAVSADGRYVVFVSEADNLVPDDTNHARDVFVRDQVMGTTERVSLSVSGQQGNGNSILPAISADGQFVAFTSYADNLVPGDTNQRGDVFVRDRTAGTTERVSLSSEGAEGHTTEKYMPAGQSPSISADGRFVAFESNAADLIPGNTRESTNIFVRDRVMRTTELVSVSVNGAPGNSSSQDPSISADGRYVAFQSYARDLGPDDVNGEGHIYVRDRTTGTTERVSVSSGGAAGNESSHLPSLSSDGRFIAFSSDADNLVPNDKNGVEDIFVRDRTKGTTERVSVSAAGQEGNGTSYGIFGGLSISADGRCVAFVSRATNLVPGDTSELDDIFVGERPDTSSQQQ
jgi:Tol biopolymer transport system component